jgi:hypothetical protein
MSGKGLGFLASVVLVSLIAKYSKSENKQTSCKDEGRLLITQAVLEP